VPLPLGEQKTQNGTETNNIDADLVAMSRQFADVSVVLASHVVKRRQQIRL